MDTDRLSNVATTCTEDGQTGCKKWLHHVQRIPTNRLTKMATACKEDGQTDCQKWLQHVQRMDRQTAKVAKTYTEDGHKQTAKIGYNM